MSEPNNNTAVVKREPLSIAQDVGAKFGMEGSVLIKTLRESIFPLHKNGQPATDSELVSFLAICREHGMNPFVGEIYPYESQTGQIKTIISVDGWLRKINEHPQFDGMDLTENEKDGKPVSVTCTIFRKDRQRQTPITEYMIECYRNTDPWNKMPRRMLRHKAIRQAARYAFGFASVHDEDYYDEPMHVGSGVSESIANATTSKTKALGEKLKAASTPKQIEVPLVPTDPGEATQATVPPPPVKPEGAKADKTVPPSPEIPPAPVKADNGDQVISKTDRDSLVAIVLQKPAVTKEEAQAAMKAQLDKYGYAKTTEIKCKDYPAILDWAKNWETGEEL